MTLDRGSLTGRDLSESGSKVYVTDREENPGQRSVTRKRGISARKSSRKADGQKWEKEHLVVRETLATFP